MPAIRGKIVGQSIGYRRIVAKTSRFDQVTLNFNNEKLSIEMSISGIITRLGIADAARIFETDVLAAVNFVAVCGVTSVVTNGRTEDFSDENNGAGLPRLIRENVTEVTLTTVVRDCTCMSRWNILIWE